MNGDEIKALRKSLGMTQKEFAESLGTHQVVVSRWETKRHRPRGLAIKAILRLKNIAGKSEHPAYGPWTGPFPS